MTDSDSWLSLDDKLGVGNSENDSLEEDVEPDSLETLLPEDENELLPGLIDELNFNGLPDELEECDVFCTGGGMELDVESQENHAVDSGAANSFVPRKRPNTSGRVSVEHPNGEHPSRTLFVRNINSSVEDSELTALFEVCELVTVSSLALLLANLISICVTSRLGRSGACTLHAKAEVL